MQKPYTYTPVSWYSAYVMKRPLFLCIASMVFAAVLGSCATFRQQPASESFFVHAQGSDRNNGLTRETAFRSLFKAVVMAANSPIRTITVIGTLDAESEQSANPERVFLIQGMSNQPILIRGESSGGAPAVLSAEGSGRRAVLTRGTLPVRFENIEISGGTSTGEGGGLGIGPSSRVTLGLGAVIRNNHSGAFGGGVIITPGGSLFIDGGHIIDNRSGTMGGGVAAAGQSAALVFYRGEISGNQAMGGGGVALLQGSSFTFAGGYIDNNTATIAGGGVMVNQGALFTMEQGFIQNNRSAGSGGGIVLMDRSSFTLLDGAVQGNRAGEHGGGIAADHTGLISVQGGSISTNHAAAQGGGVFTAGAFVKSAGTIYGIDAPEETANVAAAGAAVFVFRPTGNKIRQQSAADGVALDAGADYGWNLPVAASAEEAAPHGDDQAAYEADGDYQE